MTDDKKKELFPYFAYLYSQELNPEKYGQASSIEEWTSLIQDSAEDIQQITNAAENLTDEDWDGLDKQYTEQMNTAQTQYAKKGAKLQKLKMGTKETKPELMKKGGKKKKCSCGCEVVAKKFKGGKLVDTCGCCGKDHATFMPESFKVGGKVKLEKKIVKKQAGGDSTSASSQVGVAKCGGKVKDRIKKAQDGAALKNPKGFDKSKGNPYLKGMNNAAVDSVQRYNNRPGGAAASESGSDKRTAKETLNDLRTGKSKLPKKAKGGDLSKVALKKDELRNAKIANPNPTEMQKTISGKKNRIGKAKIDSAKCGKKLKPKMK